MQGQDKSGPGHKSASCMSIASASKSRIHMRETTKHVIGLVLFPSRGRFVYKMRHRIETEACVSTMFSNWLLKFSCSGGISHEMNATNTCEMGMHQRDGPGGGPVSARVDGQPVYDDWFVSVSFPLFLVPDCVDA